MMKTDGQTLDKKISILNYPSWLFLFWEQDVHLFFVGTGVDFKNWPRVVSSS
jgi:hypothetical protein